MSRGRIANKKTEIRWICVFVFDIRGPGQGANWVWVAVIAIINVFFMDVCCKRGTRWPRADSILAPPTGTSIDTECKPDFTFSGETEGARWIFSNDAGKKNSVKTRCLKFKRQVTLCRWQNTQKGRGWTIRETLHHAMYGAAGSSSQGVPRNVLLFFF